MWFLLWKLKLRLKFLAISLYYDYYLPLRKKILDLYWRIRVPKFLGRRMALYKTVLEHHLSREELEKIEAVIGYLVTDEGLWEAIKASSNNEGCNKQEKIQ